MAASTEAILPLLQERGKETFESVSNKAAETWEVTSANMQSLKDSTMANMDEATTTTRAEASETSDAARAAAQETVEMVQREVAPTIAYNKAKKVATTTWKSVHEIFRAKNSNATTNESVDQAHQKDTIMKEEIDAAMEQVKMAQEHARQTVKRFLSRVKHVVLDEALLVASRK